MEAAGEAVKTLVEMKRVTGEYELQQAVLRADVLDVSARLTKSRYELMAAQDRLATQRELLNDLLGRDVTTPFRVAPIPELEPSDLTLESARARAGDNRPEIRQADLKERQASTSAAWPRPSASRT